MNNKDLSKTGHFSLNDEKMNGKPLGSLWETAKKLTTTLKKLQKL